MKRTRLFVCLVIFLLAGCLRLERDYPEKQFYTLEAARPAGGEAAPLPAALRVEKLRVASPFKGKNFIYRTGDLRYEEDFYHRFFASPAELITDAASRWLRAAGLFSQVYPQPAPLVPEYLLEGDVSALYGDFSSRPPLAVLEIDFTLLREETGGPSLLLRRDYRRRIPLENQGPAALAAGWSRALAQILAELERDVRGDIIDKRDKSSE